MARRVFFSFEYGDVQRAMVVRNSWVTQDREAAGFIDAAEVESLSRQGDAAIRRWISDQLNGTSVTVVLVGPNTCTSKWVDHEVEQSKARGNGLLGIDISLIKDFNQRTTTCCGTIPYGYPFYAWEAHGGYANVGEWIEQAAKSAGR